MGRALSACLALWALAAGHSGHAGVAISPPPPPPPRSSSSSSSSPAPPLAATPSPGRARMRLDPSAALGLELYHALRAAAGGGARNLLFSPLAAAATLGLAKRAEPGDSGGGGGARAAARREMHGGGGTADAAAPAGADRGDPGPPAAAAAAAAAPPPLSVSEWSDQARLASALFLRANATGPAEGNGSGADAGVYRLGAVAARDAADSINSWAERCTAGGVPELVTEQDVGGPGGARWVAADGAALVSAAWFHGRWQRAFPAENTRRFHFSRDDGAETQLSMMYQQAELPYAEVSEGQLVEVPCEGGELALLLALPRQEVPLASLERALRPRLLSDWIHALKRQRVELYLPRFRLDVRTALGEALVKIGHVKDALAAGGGGGGGGGGGAAAALAAASLQRAVLDVTEDGTEALSPAGLNSMGKSPGYLYPQVIADHPFFFMLRSRVTGAVLLMGRLTDPDPVADVDFNVDVL